MVYLFLIAQAYSSNDLAYADIELKQDKMLSVRLVDTQNSFAQQDNLIAYLNIIIAQQQKSVVQFEYQKVDSIFQGLFPISDEMFNTLNDGVYESIYFSLESLTSSFIVSDIKSMVGFLAQNKNIYASSFDGKVQIKLNSSSTLCDVYECQIYLVTPFGNYHFDTSFNKINRSFVFNSTNLRIKNAQVGYQFNSVVENFKKYGFIVSIINSNNQTVQLLHQCSYFETITNIDFIVHEDDYFNQSAVLNYVEVKDLKNKQLQFTAYDVFFTIQAMETAFVHLSYTINNISTRKVAVILPLANREYTKRYSFVWNFSDQEIMSFNSGEVSNLSLTFESDNEFIWIGEFMTDFRLESQPKLYFSQQFNEAEVNISVAANVINPCGEGTKLKVVIVSGNVTAVFNKLVTKVQHIFQFNSSSSNISNQAHRFEDNSRLYGIFVRFTSEDGKCIVSPINIGNAYDKIQESGWEDDNIADPIKRNMWYNGTQMMLDNDTFHMIAGEMHPGRIPYQYWQHRIQMAKAMGVNTIALYVFWNQHQQNSGIIDFIHPQNNIAKFIQIAQYEGLFVNLRPGPYACGEWDFGGIPPELLHDKNLMVRTVKDEQFKGGVQKYIIALAKHIVSQMIYNGGNIITIQIENEYGSWPVARQEQEYISWLVQQWEENGINGPFITADGSWLLNNVIHPKGAAIGLDGNCGESDFNAATSLDSSVPIVVTEIYPGWLVHWGENDWQATDISSYITDYMNKKINLNFYVIHGGTNFGFTAGANSVGKESFQPDLTSYDYGAPINEQGSAVNNYVKYRDIIFAARGIEAPKIPAPIKTIEIPSITIQRIGNIFGQVSVKEEIMSDPQHFEYFGQNQGFIVYATNTISTGLLKFAKLHDYAQVFINQKYIGTIDRTTTEQYEILINESGYLEILVEAMGHINAGIAMETDFKGIFDLVTLNGQPLTNWSHSRFPILEMKLNETIKAQETKHNIGGVFRGSFNLTDIGDTFLDFSQFEKGFVIVNGQNIGRYWTSKGPQKRLFCPGVWLKSINNDIIILDSVVQNPSNIKGYKTYN